MKHKEAERPCPICGNASVEVLHHQKFFLPDEHVLPSAYDVVWCPVCGFAYADTPASQQVYDSYYAAFSKYEDNRTSTGGGGCEFDLRRLRETAADIAAIVPDRRARIVDLGCANGGLLGGLKALGFSNLAGIDPSPVCVANTAAEYGIPARAGSLRQLPPDFGTFDLVILSHVLEHVADLQSSADTLDSLLNDNGLLYVEVPDASRYDEFLLAPFQDFNTEHINHFGLSALRNLFERRGFVLTASGQKDIESSPGCPYPAVYGFFRKSVSGKAAAQKSLEVDAGFRAGMIHYIERSREKIAQIEEKLARWRDGSTPLIVWGTGQLTMKLLSETSLAAIPIAAFVDSNPINQRKMLAGRPILAPNEIKDHTAPILIATMLHDKEISATIRGTLQLPNPIITLRS
jgi:SAM-dependent methyltransferase